MGKKLDLAFCGLIWLYLGLQTLCKDKSTLLQLSWHSDTVPHLRNNV